MGTSEREMSYRLLIEETKYVRIINTASAKVREQAWKLLIKEYADAHRTKRDGDNSRLSALESWMDQLSDITEESDLAGKFGQEVDSLPSLEMFRRLADAVERVQKSLEVSEKR